MKQKRKDPTAWRAVVTWKNIMMLKVNSSLFNINKKMYFIPVKDKFINLFTILIEISVNFRK